MRARAAAWLRRCAPSRPSRSISATTTPTGSSRCAMRGARCAEVIGFYQCRILDEAFLSTATQDSSEELIYHSLGHVFPPNATATTTLAYHLPVIGRGRGGGVAPRVGRGHGDEPADDRPAEQRRPRPVTAPALGQCQHAGERAQPTGSRADGWIVLGLPSVGTPAGVHRRPAGATQPLSLGVSSAIFPAPPRSARSPAGNQPVPGVRDARPDQPRTWGYAPGRVRPSTAPPPADEQRHDARARPARRRASRSDSPCSCQPRAPSGGAALRWIRLLTDVHPDAKRGSTRISWNTPLGTLAGEPSPTGVSNLLVYGFARSSALAAAGAPDWSAQTNVRQLRRRRWPVVRSRSAEASRRVPTPA